jgi:stearoyl-CoA desaturase (delta-9 desaturase)
MDLLTPAGTWAPREISIGDDRAGAARSHRMPLVQQVTMFVSVVGPIAGLLAAIMLLWHRGPASMGWPEIAVMAGFGVTIGFHRLLAHRAFETPRAMRLILAICGSIAAQGAVIRWCATHRHHHRASDREGDPHSPRPGR